MSHPDPQYKLKYPIGPFSAPETITNEMLDELIATIEDAPRQYKIIAEGLSQEHLTKTYREGSWNVKQLFNHVADMQMLHFFRMKKAVTESDYKEITLVDIEGWTKTADGLDAPIVDAIQMIEGVTARFVFLMKSLTPQQLDISYYHPVRKITLNQRQAIAMTAWHVRHHLEHIKIACGNQ